VHRRRVKHEPHRRDPFPLLDGDPPIRRSADPPIRSA
jgi:hypothetical protein